MKTSFIVTTYNVLPYLDRCFKSLAESMEPEDRVIIVDDGSTDGSAEQLDDILNQSGFGPDVERKVVLLGTNTIGGVGIAGNVGLYEALSDPACETVFFVDGDDWMEPAGFRACRRVFEQGRPDILIGGYTEYNELENTFRQPADTHLWPSAKLVTPSDLEAARNLALRMIAVPWRKFYRADFLRKHALRYPEGDFFFEDNPFHWSVCRKAQSIHFCEAVLCAHRFNRPGQTMTSTGFELSAFFTHYETICAGIRADHPAGNRNLEVLALTWLLDNMSWHIERLQVTAHWPYAAKAVQSLKAPNDQVWDATLEKFSRVPIGPMAAELRKGNISGVTAYWAQIAQIAALEARLSIFEEQMAAASEGISALSEIKAFEAIQTLHFGDSG
ncbi:glycosyltransferase family 2 protein [Donghicola mangrovi]|uniref:Glycosyltransferase family 2 protein n=1 Tax=Donghicola mangrovi TaxID=2729614 RepID=A0A850Q7F3_9RHOB|nr:glycosyltransferase family 2 protein [Donghicola mangrovi]NVO25737.1 glycosyltransferase family 2 protein [Donghicola mangrovi]